MQKKLLECDVDKKLKKLKKMHFRGLLLPKSVVEYMYDKKRGVI